MNLSTITKHSYCLHAPPLHITPLDPSTLLIQPLYSYTTTITIPVKTTAHAHSKFHRLPAVPVNSTCVCCAGFTAAAPVPFVSCPSDKNDSLNLCPEKTSKSCSHTVPSAGRVPLLK